MFGISVYSGLDIDLETNIRYIRNAKRCGINTIFTSLHIPESNSDLYKESIKIIELATELDMDIIADISKEYLKKIDITRYNIYALRLDFGFTEDEIIELTKNKQFKIHLNASTINKEELERLMHKGIDINNIEMCHNYYPRRDTGISYELMMERNKAFKEYNLKIYGFIPSNNKDGMRGPIYEGLPTLEIHRDKPIIVSAQHLLRSGIDSIIIGDAMASQEELKILTMISEDILMLPAEIKEVSDTELYIAQGIHTNRTDPGEKVIRSQEARSKKGSIIKPNGYHMREKYSITIDNCLYKRYEGELQILRDNLTKDERVNVIGRVLYGDIMLPMLKPGGKFKFYYS
ncbi:MupG family TIM beta-alpha barrel fold protein [Clostridiaceae bacterium M8S5]|nr:MupG family TIM beta-alpha barrel fold protein [Clostridiaceae bacterium M8S5]